jgi:prepilin-type processing-associated H-X9-DG protein
VLAGMLLPALENGIDAARQIQCASNMKQIYISTQGYAEDYDGWIVPASMDNGWSWCWEAQLCGTTQKGNPIPARPTWIGYGINVDTLMCPSDPVGYGKYTDGKYQYLHYGINCWLTGCLNSSFTNRNIARKWTQIKAPSIALLLADSGTCASHTLSWNQELLFRHGGGSATSYSGYIYRNWDDQIGIANFCFSDGHVSSMSNPELPRESSKTIYDASKLVFLQGY